MELYPYQRTGAEWLAGKANALLADDPGLGKTATVLSAAGKARAHRLLVVAPTCVLWNWAREVEQWTPYRDAVVVPSGRYANIIGRTDTAIVTHGMLLNPKVREAIKANQWDAVVLDESHFFRNRTAKRSSYFYGYIAEGIERVWCLSATPMPNDASELWTMARGFGATTLSFTEWRAHFCKTVWSPFGDHVKVIGNKNTDELRELLAPYVLRRRKRDVLPDLPAMRYETVPLRCETMPSEIELLEGELDLDLVARIKRLDNPEAAFAEIGQSKAFAAYRRLCGLAKAEAVSTLLETELASGLDKVVVMAHHSDVVGAIAHNLRAYGVVSVTGATPAAQRKTAVDAFQKGKARVFVGNIVAAGTGITLTAASELVFAELSYVPGENAQAADRIHRIGQKAGCRVRFVALDGTLDESLVGVLRRKTAMIREVMER